MQDYQLNTMNGLLGNYLSGVVLSSFTAIKVLKLRGVQHFSTMLMQVISQEYYFHVVSS